jgi:hypothetical protein
MQTLAPGRSIGRRAPAADVALALAIGLAATLAKRYLDFHLGFPGHAGVGWIAVLISGRLVNGRSGMATVAGLSMGLWGIPVGLGHSVGYNTLLYGLAGAILDSVFLLGVPFHRAWGATLAGTIVHLAKFGFVFANAWISGIMRNVEIYGFLAALRNHIAFGAFGGLVGWAAGRAGRKFSTNRPGRRRTR